METQATSTLPRQEKRQLDKNSRHGDKDSQVSNSSNRSSGRSKRQTEFFGRPLKHSVKSLKGNQANRSFSRFQFRRRILRLCQGTRRHRRQGVT